MVRTGLTALILAAAVCGSPLLAQEATGKGANRQAPADLKVELRSATGSNRFQLGAVIPLEVSVWSTTPDRFLEPCKMFWESCFGFPQCRFFTEWSLDVVPPPAGRTSAGTAA